MEYDNGENYSSGDYEATPADSMKYIVHEILFSIFAFVGVCANVAIIYTIMRFRKLKTKQNVFLANWAIADLLSLLFAPSGYRIISVLDNFTLPPEFMCTVLHLGASFQATTVCFVLLVTIDWLVAAYFEKASEKMRSYYKYIVATVWIVTLVIVGISTGFCLDNNYIPFQILLILILFCALMLAVIVGQVSRAVRKYYKKRPLEYPSLMLTLTTTLVGCWFSAFVLTLSLSVTYLVPNTLVEFFAVIIELLLFGSSFVVLTMLYYKNLDFQACFLQVLRRSDEVKYKESLNFSNPIVRNSNHKDSVQISFNTDPSEQLLDNEY